jgi:membrane protein required for colicin V production
MFRGLLSEIFSLVDILLSSLITVPLKKPLNDYFIRKEMGEILSNIASSLIVFIFVIIILSIISKKLQNKIEMCIPKSININLGMAFGFIKGFLLSSLIFITILSVSGDTEDLSIKSGPKWLQDSLTYRPLSFGGWLLLPLFNSMTGDLNKQMEQQKAIDKIIEDVEYKNEELDDVGYKKEQRDKLEHLIDVIE